MKRLTAWLLIAGLLLPNASTVKAAELDPKTSVSSLSSEESQQTDAKEKGTADGDQVDWSTVYAPEEGTGGLEIRIGHAVPLEREVTFHITAESAQDKKKTEKDITLKAFDDADYEAQTAAFENLPNGSYTVSITAPGFAKYTQEVTVQGNILSAEIYTGTLNLEDTEYTEGQAHPGVLLIGDADGDGSITENDKVFILDAASGGASTGHADLNGDGAVDLADLQYYTASWKQQNEIDTKAVWTTRVAAGAVTVKANTGTKIEGSAETLLSDTGKVSLTRTDGSEITEDNAVEIGIALQSQSQEEAGEYVNVEQIQITTGDNGIQNGQVTLETKDGEESYDIENGALVQKGSRSAGTSQTLTIDLEGQVAVKRVIIRVTQTSGKNNLVDITKVEFLNDMENRIPEPDLDIPQKLAAQAANKSFTLTWEACKNITGYEVEVAYNGSTEIARAATNTLKIASFQGKELVNGQSYSVRVQAINGSWKSGYGTAIQAVPKQVAKPGAPDYVKATGGYQRIDVSWKQMEDTDSYLVYYREKGKTQYEKSASITGTSYQITGLKDQTTYEIYVTGVNDLGESDPSLTAEATTTVLTPATLPTYGLINTSNGTGAVSDHIVSVIHPRGEMKGSVLDADSTDSALGLVDNDYGSYYYVKDWDEGGTYPASNKGLYITFDQQYTMNYITFAEIEDVWSFATATVYYYEEDHTTEHKAVVTGVIQKTDENGRKYYAIKLKDPITTDRIRVGVGRAYGHQYYITIAEMNFYHYDSLEDEVLALYADDLHTELEQDVTLSDIEALQERLDTRDPDSGEYHPERESIQQELDNARELLETPYGEVTHISSEITAARDTHLGISGLNAWQPLGVSAGAGERIVIYVAHNSLKSGANTTLDLIATQYHAESDSVSQKVATLKVGRNELSIPELQSIAGAESGGALYVQYTGNNSNDQYAVRVSGGTEISVLNLYGVTDADERQERISDYIDSLTKQVQELEDTHNAHHTSGEDYDQCNCIAGATDIMLDQMMYSVSAKQIAAALDAETSAGQVQQLDQSLQAMEQMMTLFYQHKGLTAATTNSGGEALSGKDRLPSQHLNIRYMRMFTGAFMYAAGNHIGIEWGSVSGLAKAVPIVSDNGQYTSGQLFGWGIAHEIGHNINQGIYAVAEITNNYFAQLTTARDTNESVRFDYENVYEKVTSNTIGSSDNQATQLAMYWQLHLAYDRGYNFKTYDTYEEQFDNLFYARVDTYARDASRAPSPGGVALVLEGDTDQIFMRLACAAAEKDLTEYFTRWGMVPNAGTLAYAGQFEEEERAIYYGNDDARVYEIEHGTAGSIKGQNVITSSTATVAEDVSNEVKLTIQSSADAEILSGYEIIRCTYEGGEVTRQVAGFATISGDSTTVEWKDHIFSLNNRVVAYEVKAVDKFGYYSAVKQVGAVRISSDGSLDKSMWSVTTNMTSALDSSEDATVNDPCEPTENPAIAMVIDNDYKTETYTGTAENEDAWVVLSMKQSYAVSALKYTAAGSQDRITDFRIEVSEDGKQWTTVREDTFQNVSESQIVYFQKEGQEWVATYDAAYVRLTAKGTAGEEVAITELDVLGPTGDSISFGLQDGKEASAVGILDTDYEYAEGSTIPAGSLVFMGRYKGNPAYNVVLLYDEEGNIVGGQEADGSICASQIILADVPDDGLPLGEVSDGIWIYWIEPDQSGDLPEVSGKVRAELYRVDDALTNEGQRLVSDTLPLTIPDELGKMEFSE